MKSAKDARTLRDLITERGYVREPEVLSLFIDIAVELASVHSQATLHGDIKPEKIIRDRTGKYALTDYGISRLGTARYMSPERARRIQTDARSDIYSLGVVLFEAATGRPPFEGMNYQVIEAHVKDSPPLPKSVRPEVSAGLQRIILTAMSKDPADRYQTAQAFADALQGLSREQLASQGSPDKAGLTPVMTPAGSMSDRRPPPPSPKPDREGRDRVPATATAPTKVKREKPADPVRTGKAAPTPEPPRARAAVETAARAESPAVSPGPTAASPPARPAAAPAKTRGPARPARPATGRIQPTSLLRTIGRSRPVLLAGGGTLLLVVLLLLLLPGGKTSVPELLGLDEAGATRTAEQHNLVFVIEGTRDDTIPAGRVVAQRPAPGEKAGGEDTVYALLSTGEVEVPDVLNLSVGEATERMSRVALTVSAADTGYSDRHRFGAVAAANPAPGTRVEPGAAVRLTVAGGRATCAECGTRRAPGARFCTACGWGFEN